MEQILINLVAGALGGVGAGKSSPTLISVQLVTLFRVWLEAGCSAKSSRYCCRRSWPQRSRQSEYWRHYLTSDRRWCWRGHTHCAHWCNQKQSRCLNVNPSDGSTSLRCWRRSSFSDPAMFAAIRRSTQAPTNAIARPVLLWMATGNSGLIGGGSFI
jgi:hypothetical protein